MAVLSDGNPKSYREIVRAIDLGGPACLMALKRYCKKGLVLAGRKVRECLEKNP